MSTDMFEKITNQLIENLNIKPKIIVLDGSGFSSDYSEEYCLIIRGYNVKHYAKYHIAIDVGSRIILCSRAVIGHRHNTKFAIAVIRSLKKYNIQYIMADKEYGIEPIKNCINE